MKHLAMLLLCAMLAVGATGCAAISKALPYLIDTVLYVQDAAQVLDMIDAHVKTVLKAVPNPEVEANYAVAMKASREALTIALRAAKGAQNLSQEKVDQAFHEWDQAWKKLQALLTGASLMGPGGKLLGAGGAEVATIPVPLLATRQADGG
jgi:hypothetical protein